MTATERRASQAHRRSFPSTNHSEALHTRMQQLHANLTTHEVPLGVDGITVSRKILRSDVRSYAGGSGTLRVKAALLGDSVGKSLLASHCTGKRGKPTEHTIGMDSWTFDFAATPGQHTVPMPPAKVTLWDMAASAQYAEVRNEFFKECTAVVLCFSPGVPASFKNLPRWVAEVKQHAGNVDSFVIASLLESPHASRETRRDEAERFAQGLGAALVEIDLSSGQGVNEFVEAVMKVHLRRR